MHRVSDVLARYNPERKPALVFCSTRKGTITAGESALESIVVIPSTLKKCYLAAKILHQSQLRFVRNAEHRHTLLRLAASLQDSTLRGKRIWLRAHLVSLNS